MFTLLGCTLRGRVQDGPAVDDFYARMGKWLGAPHVFGAASGRSAFQLALETLDLPEGSEIVFPEFTFPVMPMVAKILGYRPVFSKVDPVTYNSGPAEIEAVLTERTGAVLATHLFGLPCPIREIAELTKARGIRLMEDCAHACGVTVDGKHVGTFGDIGVFSFAEGKNMPCLGGGAIAVNDNELAERARKVLSSAAMPSTGELVKQGLSIWAMWLATRPLVFGLTAYQVLKLKAWRGQPLMDSAVGDELLQKFASSNPKVKRFSNLQASIGLTQLRHIDAFNAGARENARILTEELGDVPGIRVPPLTADNIYVYYPITVDPSKRDDLRLALLRAGIDTKRSDMSECSALATFQDARGAATADHPPAEASVLEICVYPIVPQHQMRRIARTIRTWAGLSAERGRLRHSKPHPV